MYSNWTPNTDVLVVLVVAAVLGLVLALMVRRDKAKEAEQVEFVFEYRGRVATMSEGGVIRFVDNGLEYLPADIIINKESTMQEFTYRGRPAVQLEEGVIQFLDNGTVEYAPEDVPCGYCGTSLDPNDICGACFPQPKVDKRIALLTEDLPY